MEQRRIRITIDNKGGYKLLALDGFSGQSCIEKTKTIEMVLGGEATDEGKTDSYYDPEDNNTVSISDFNM